MKKTNSPSPSPSSFQFRMFVAVLLLAILIVMEKNNLNVAGITAEKISAMISNDIEDKLEAWAERLVND